MFPVKFKSMTSKERHDYVLQTFILNKPRIMETAKRRHDIDVIKQHHRFLWDEKDVSVPNEHWGVHLAQRYYSKLFKEYCIADLTHYKENKLALRWRTEAEVVTGKGQFQCGCRNCDQRENLKSWEVNFAYQEQGLRKNALVKLRLCLEHSNHLNYSSHKKEIKRLKHSDRCMQRSKRKHEDECYTKETSTDVKIEQPGVLTKMANNIENSEEIDSNGDKDLENVWNKKLDEEKEEKSRETDFEHYLEDLLL